MTENDTYADMIRIAMVKHKDDVDGVIEMLEELLPAKITDSIRSNGDTMFFLRRLVAALAFLKAMKSTSKQMDEMFGPIDINDTKLDA